MSSCFDIEFPLHILMNLSCSWTELTVLNTKDKKIHKMLGRNFTRFQDASEQLNLWIPTFDVMVVSEWKKRIMSMVK